MDENTTVESNEMNDAELLSALQKLSELTTFEKGRATFDSMKVENNREEYIQIVSSKRGPSPKNLPCKNVVLTRGLGPDGKIHALQIINPAKRVLQQERLRKKKNRRN